MLNFGASKPRVKGGARAPGPPPLDPHLHILRMWRLTSHNYRMTGSLQAQSQKMVRRLDFLAL